VITVGSVDRPTAARWLDFLAEDFRERRKAIRRLTHGFPEFVFWIHPDGGLGDAVDSHKAHPPPGFRHIIDDEPDCCGFLRGRVVRHAGRQLIATKQPVVSNAPGNGAVVPVGNPLTIGVVEAGFIKTFESPGFTLDLRNPDHHALFNHLKSAKLPCPTRCLPKGLKGVPGLGCRELEIDGKRCNVKCKLTWGGKPDIRTKGNGSVFRWSDDDWVFVLMGKEGVDAKRLEGMF